MTETTETRVTHRRRFTLVWLAITGLILSLVVAAPALAVHTGPLVTPDITTYDFPGDNPNCNDLVADELITAYDDEDKSGDSPSGDEDLENSSINVTDEEVSFEADEGWLVVAAIIKGGNEGAAVYVYEGFGGADGVDHDNGLMTPTGQGVSHVTLCLIEEEEESQPESVPESVPESQTEGSVGGGTGTPAGSVPDTATSLPGFGGPLATLIFGAILVASLGTLAYANVRAAKQRQ